MRQRWRIYWTGVQDPVLRSGDQHRVYRDQHATAKQSIRERWTDTGQDRPMSYEGRRLSSVHVGRADVHGHILSQQVSPFHSGRPPHTPKCAIWSRTSRACAPSEPEHSSTVRLTPRSWKTGPSRENCADTATTARRTASTIRPKVRSWRAGTSPSWKRRHTLYLRMSRRKTTTTRKTFFGPRRC